ncbi:hypothetical protein ACA910_002314 [Epithemia clementina (nom. ined.)]
MAMLVMMMLVALSVPAQACSCLRRTFAQQYSDSENVSTVYILGQAKVDKNGYFLEWVNPDDDEATDGYAGDVYYLVFNKKTHKGPCRGRRQYQWLKTNGSSASCGIRLQRGQWYVLGSTKNADHPNWLLNVGLCSLVVPVESLTQGDRNYIQSHTTTCRGK